LKWSVIVRMAAQIVMAIQQALKALAILRLGD
jgi:hypothetical protein